MMKCSNINLSLFFPLLGIKVNHIRSLAMCSLVFRTFSKNAKNSYVLLYSKNAKNAKKKNRKMRMRII